jgi:predicted O-methyltransferase YrrM
MVERDASIFAFLGLTAFAAGYLFRSAQRGDAYITKQSPPLPDEEDVASKSSSSQSPADISTTSPPAADLPANDDVPPPFYSSQWMAITSVLYAESMGCENMGPLLYQLVRFTKSRRILEVGSGYTSIFLLQGLMDNIQEIHGFQTRNIELQPYPKLSWVVDSYLKRTYNRGRLTCIDNLGHESTTAHAVKAVAETLRLDDLLDVEHGDAYEYGASEVLEDDELDMLWVDFGDGDKLDVFLEGYWCKVKAAGGLIIVHSTVTNEKSSQWLNEFKTKAGSLEYGLFELVSLMEPHKQRQNSCTMIQRRGWNEEPYVEPLYSRYA